MPAKDRIFGLDLLRATAVLLVVFHHSLSFTAASTSLYAYGWLGEIGVGALLVLSGYLIGQGLIKKSKEGRFSKVQHLGQFYARRWSRTFPPYFFYLFIMAALTPSFIHVLLTHKLYFFFLQNFAWDPPPFYCQTWTLALLEFFYLLFPLLLLLTSKFVRNYLVCLFIPMALLFLIPLILRALHTQIEPPDRFEETFRKWVVFRIDTPIIGVAAAVVQAELPLVWAWLLHRSWIGLCTFSSVMLYHYLGCPHLYSNHWIQVFFHPFSALMLAPLLPFLCNWKINTSIFGTMMSTISQTSYSLYVSHFFALIIGLCILTILGISSDRWLITYPVYILLIALVTCPSYYLTEEPFIRLREAKSPSYFSAIRKFASRTFSASFPPSSTGSDQPDRPLANAPRN